MLIDALQFLSRTVLDLFATAFFLRFWMQWARVPFHNPFALFIVKVTDFAVRPVRRVVPGLFGMDWASLLLMFSAAILSVLIVQWLSGFPFGVAGIDVLPGFLLMGIAGALRLALYILMGLVILQAVMSWVNPHSPFAPVFYALARPILAPFQRWIPPIGGVDVSPIVCLLAMQLILVAPVAALERAAMSWAM